MCVYAGDVKTAELSRSNYERTSRVEEESEKKKFHLRSGRRADPPCGAGPRRACLSSSRNFCLARATTLETKK